MSLIVEADFVPVKGFGCLPLPFNPENSDAGIAWLYTCAPQIYSISNDGFAEGYSTSMVAYIATPQAAAALIDLADQVSQDPGPYNYSPWDSSIDSFLRAKGLRNYVPFRNYGEHGGLPNLEHQRFGLSKVHRADILFADLALLPAYAAQGSRLSFRKERLLARLKGIGRLVLGKYLRPAIFLESSYSWRLLRWALVRQATLRL
jgi:hypothetical protein